MRDPNDTHFYRSSPKGNFSELLQKIQTISETFSAQTTEDRNTFDHASSFAHVGDLSPAYWEAAGFSDEEKYEIQDLLITGYSREARTLYEKAEKQGSISNNHYQRLGADEFSQLCWCVQKISGHDLHDRGVYNCH